MTAELLARLIEEVSIGNTEQHRRKKPLEFPRPPWVAEQAKRATPQRPVPREYVAAGGLPPDADPEALAAAAPPRSNVIAISDYSRRAVGVLAATARRPGES